MIAPYATALAAMIDPSAAAENLARLATIGARGTYGFYEALDYTPSRRPEDGGPDLIRAYMAHHQGMALLALCNVLFDDAIQRYFHAEPQVLATELLLHERVPTTMVAEAEPAPVFRDLGPAIRR